MTSSKGSTISVTESERTTASRHKYNTRSSAKFYGGLGEEKDFLYANPYSKSINKVIKTGQDVNQCFDENLNDSREFNYENEYLNSWALSLPNFEGKLRWNRKVDDVYVNKGTWKFYVFIFAAVGLIVVPYLSQIVYDMGKMSKEIGNLKTNTKLLMDAKLETQHKLIKMESLLAEVKKGQANFRLSLKHMIEEEITKLTSDKTGRTDFALESSGGRIVQLTPGTENYGEPKNSLFGLSLCEGLHGPRTMIQASSAPGECWALKGTNGGVLIKLIGSVLIDAVSLEHISKKITPSGESNSAPKEFSVWGLQKPNDRGQSLGLFTYNIKGPLVQMFPLETIPTVYFDYVEFKVHSNHGHPNFTCVYRFRVHGKLHQSSV